MIDSFEKRGSSPDVMTQSDLMFNTEVRRKFISKVYSILTTQLIITVVISFLFTMM